MFSFLIYLSLCQEPLQNGESELFTTIKNIKSALNNNDAAAIDKLNKYLQSSIQFLGKDIKYVISKIEKSGVTYNSEDPASNSILFFPYSDISIHIKFLDRPNVEKVNVKGNFANFDAFHQDEKTQKKTKAPLAKDGRFLNSYTRETLVLHFENPKGGINIESLDFE